MQYANTITPLTLASTATLRRELQEFNPHMMKAAIQSELQSRIPGNSIAEKNAEIEDLESDIESLKEEIGDGDDELAVEQNKHDETQSKLDLAIEKLKENGIEFAP